MMDTEAEQAVVVSSDETERTIHGDEINSGKQMVIHQGESQTSRTKSRKRKSPCCPRRPAKTRKAPLPEGFGYMPWVPFGGEKGSFYPSFTNTIGYMTCERCGINGDHWEPFCLNPVNDPPEEEAADNPLSWKYILGDFNPREYLEKQKLKSQGKPEHPFGRVMG